MGRLKGGKNRVRNIPKCHPDREHEANGLCVKCYSAKYSKEHPEDRALARIRLRKVASRAKLEALTHYGKGGKLRCCARGCKVCDIDILTLDHINDNGAEHRRSVKGNLKGKAIYAWARRVSYPKGFQTLCANHQLKKFMQQMRRRMIKQ